MTLPTPTQLRILADFADSNVATRHSRSTGKEFAEERGALTREGWIARGEARKGQWHFITDKGIEALKRGQEKRQ